MADAATSEPARDIEPRLEAEAQHAAAVRHDIHAHPEVMFEEERTMGVVCRELEEAGVAYTSGHARGTGVLGFLPATTKAPEDALTVGLRADMDALPIAEETGLPYASTKPGTMHACGHDGHTASLVGTARLLAQAERRPNNVLFCFQPAEEGGGGANLLCQEGALDGSLIGRPVDRMYGAHGYPELEIGKVATRDGVIFASTDEFRLTLTGTGGHAAYPHNTTDPVVMGAHLVAAMQSVVSRRVSPTDPAVITFGSFRAGSTFNVIPDSAELLGTIRALDPKTRAFLEEEFRLIVNNTAATFGGSARIEWIPGYPATLNDPELTARFRRVAATVMDAGLVVEKTAPTMGGEDFSYYGERVPASFFLVGLRPEGWHSYPGLHTPRFDYNDDALAITMRLFAALALDAG